VSLLLDRKRSADRRLLWNVRLFSVGAVLGIASIYLEERWMTSAAILVLLGGVALRFFSGARPDPDEEE
jgi:hypothetical protein